MELSIGVAHFIGFGALGNDGKPWQHAIRFVRFGAADTPDANKWHEYPRLTSRGPIKRFQVDSR